MELIEVKEDIPVTVRDVPALHCPLVDVVFNAPDTQMTM